MQTLWTTILPTGLSRSAKCGPRRSRSAREASQASRPLCTPGAPHALYGPKNGLLAHSRTHRPPLLVGQTHPSRAAPLSISVCRSEIRYSLASPEAHRSARSPRSSRSFHSPAGPRSPPDRSAVSWRVLPAGLPASYPVDYNSTIRPSCVLCTFLVAPAFRPTFAGLRPPSDRSTRARENAAAPPATRRTVRRPEAPATGVRLLCTPLRVLVKAKIFLVTPCTLCTFLHPPWLDSRISMVGFTNLHGWIHESMVGFTNPWLDSRIHG